MMNRSATEAAEVKAEAYDDSACSGWPEGASDIAQSGLPTTANYEASTHTHTIDGHLPQPDHHHDDRRSCFSPEVMATAAAQARKAFPSLLSSLCFQPVFPNLDARLFTRSTTNSKLNAKEKRERENFQRFEQSNCWGSG